MDGLVLMLALLSVPSPLDDLHRFPSHKTATINYEFAEKTCACLEKELHYKIDTQPADWVFYSTALPLYSVERAHLIQTLREAHRCRDCRQALTYASDKDMSYGMRGEWLADLRRLIGETSYWWGEMPPAAPWYRFRVVK